MQIIALLMPWTYLLEAIVFVFTKPETKYEDSMDEDGVVRVAMLEDKAYWVQDNIFYEADMIDGNPDIESARPVDAMTISEKEIDKLLFILDTLNDE